MLTIWILSLVSMFVLGGTAEAALQCFGCHGQKITEDTGDIRPLDSAFRNISTGGFKGNHRNHLPASATKNDCAVCHPGSAEYTSAHQNQKIRVSASVNESPATTAYKNRTTAWLRTSIPALGSCTNVNCHFEAATPSWGSTPISSPAGCSTCHSVPPAAGAHGKKHGEYYGTDTHSCTKCHVDHTQDSTPFAHSKEKRPLGIQFTTSPNNGGTYTGNVAYPNFLPSQNPSQNGTCTNIYCHSDGMGRAPTVAVTWSDSTTTTCYSCHRGKSTDFLNMTSNGHGRLVGAQWIRKYPCTYCHNATLAGMTDANGRLTDGEIIKAKHVNGQKDVVMASKWAIVGRPAPSYDPTTKVCDNVYCHSDGTTNPEQVRPFAWTEGKTECNTCHGHPIGSCSAAQCHDGRTDEKGNVWPVKTGWPSGEEWKAAIPMFRNEGAGTPRANSHARHTETNFTCDRCHASTIINGSCVDCHQDGIPPGKMGEVAHLNADYHVNRSKDVIFRDGGSYDNIAKTCTNTGARCHSSGADPVWGESVGRSVICLTCHGTANTDIDDFQAFNDTQGKINLSEWFITGHGRYSSSGNYPASGNPAANFPGNPCWYCHDNKVLHKDATNPYRLRMHPQFAKRFDKECGYCHMEGKDSECLGCHYSPESLALQVTYTSVQIKHSNQVITSGCRMTGCHTTDPRIHKTGSPFWTAEQNADVKNQYLMMGVCLQCHDDDGGGKCESCHTNPVDNPFKYTLGFDPGTGRIKPKKARASSVHFGYKHYRAFEASGGWTKDANGKVRGVWKGGKFCWDCHDPHGDSNIYMVQKKVATSTDGVFGTPLTRTDVVFTKKQSGLDYIKMQAPYDGICNVCHSAASKHFTSVSGDGHNAGRVCTTCHEHRFTDSHGDGMSCVSCHRNKPVPRHSGFGLPKDCTKCHGGTIGKRMDVMGQLRANSHHVQGVTITNRHCYACHWEATELGLIDVTYHEGYNFKNYTTVKNAKVDLAVWGAGTRPSTYKLYTTAIQFLANNMGTDNATARVESQKLNVHCLSCHSDKNNDAVPFNDCKTPRQYAWDRQSIEARYSQPGTTTWGKYAGTANAAKKNVSKALSAHGNAVANQGGWDPATGVDGTIPNTRNGAYSVTCFDCHSSHGSKVTGITSSYVTFNGTKNGGNLKETQAGKGGYAMSYKASSNPDMNSLNPYNAGAGQCFDCHMNRSSGLTPWGYQSTFGATMPVKGYKDAYRFAVRTSSYRLIYSIKNAQAVKGGHMKASSPLGNAAMGTIDGLCTPCHDPHGVSPSLTTDRQNYAVPLLKGTWMTSPYKEDNPPPDPSGANATSLSWGHAVAHPSVQPISKYNIDRNTFGGSNRISENDDKFAGLCLRCHQKSSLTDGSNKNQTWKSSDRIHESVKGWGANTEHAFTCSKCHSPHQSGLPRLMQTNCLDSKHRGNRMSGGQAWSADNQYGSAHSRGGEHRGYPNADVLGQTEASTACHVGAPLNSGTWPSKNLWNVKTPW